MNSTLKLSIIFILLLGLNLTFPHLMINISIRIWEKGIHTSIGSIKTKQLVESEKIHIVGNSGWNDFKNAGNCTGSGTTTDPYVIENLTINAEETGDCIYIGHSNVYFIIRNCLLINAGPDWYNGGIKLDNCENGFLTENNCLFNFGEQSDGIHILSSSKITILNNNLHGNWYGIYLGYSHSINVSDNLLTENFVGMRIYNSDHNTFSNNIVNNSKFSGIFIYESDDNLVLGNSLISNRDAIPLLESNSNIISGNNLWNNEENGIELIRSNNNYLSENNVNKNHKNGIFFRDQSDYNTVIDNVIEYNWESGIYMEESHNNGILDNYIKRNRIGLELSSSNLNKITNNELIHNWRCFLIQNSENNTIYSNTCKEYIYTSDLDLILPFTFLLFCVAIFTLLIHKKIKS